GEICKRSPGKGSGPGRPRDALARDGTDLVRECQNLVPVTVLERVHHVPAALEQQLRIAEGAGSRERALVVCPVGGCSSSSAPTQSGTEGEVGVDPGTTVGRGVAVGPKGPQFGGRTVGPSGRPPRRA